MSSGVPSDLDLSVFMGATLVQIGLGMHEIQFRFDLPPALLSVESAWELRGPDGAVVDQALDESALPWDREFYRVHICLSRRVINVGVHSPEGISLAFEGGYSLRVAADPAPGESFRIEPGGVYV